MIRQFFSSSHFEPFDYMSIYCLVNKMEIISKIKIYLFLFFESFNHSLIPKPIYIKIIEFPIFYSPLKLIIDYSTFCFFLCSLPQLSDRIEEAAIKSRNSLSSLLTPTIKSPHHDDFVSHDHDKNKYNLEVDQQFDTYLLPLPLFSLN